MQTPVNDNMPLAAIIAARAEASPDSLAILSIEPDGLPLTYGALRGFINDAAAMLGAVGLSRGDRVATVLPNGPEAAVAFLALSAYSTVAPLNPLYKQNEFEFYLSDLGASAVVVPEGVESSARDAARTLGARVIELRKNDSGPCGLFTLVSSEALPKGALSQANPDDVALVLHTSGTTSRPKIVPLTHANISASARNIAASLKLAENDRSLVVMPLFHVHGLIGALLSTLSSGGSVIAAPGFDAQRFLSWLDAHSPTWYTAVPTMHNAVVAATGAGAKGKHGLRFIRSCSAALAPSLMASLEKALGAPVVEAYGMTEGSHQICINPLPPLERKAGSVGLPSGAQVRIMNDANAFLPPGESGEVVIRGPGVTSGYAGNASANADSFTDGWFRTGDVGRLDADGYLYLTGRKKEMINRGGEKIAPREVDEALATHPAVIEAVTFALPHPTLGEDVAAAVTLKKGKTANEGELRAYALQRLAPFKVPARVIVVDAMPKGPTGKLKRIGLADDLKNLLDAVRVEPGTPHETRISAIWKEVLGPAARAGATDNFFQSGGDSLGATRVASRISSAFDIEAGPGMVFASPTIGGLAVRVLATQAASLDPVEFDAIISEVESLSDEEALRRTTNA